MRVGVLTGGGDCPGLNAVIRAVVKVGRVRFGHHHLGILHGWRGLLEESTRPLELEDVSGILHRGGTILRSSRTNPFKDEEGGRRAAIAVSRLGLDALVAIGGEDTLGVARRLHDEFDVPTIGVPKTIDNDLAATDWTFGFWTAVQIAVDAIDRLKTTAESHDRIMVVEVMGRHAGWIATEAGIASAADAILIPERPASVAEVAEHIRARRARGRDFSVVVVSEGAELGEGGEPAQRDEFGHVQLADVGVGERLARGLRADLDGDVRVTVLGHVQRGGSPVAYDRVLATRYGTHAAELAAQGSFGRMVALHGEEIVDVPLSAAVSELKRVPPEVYEVAEPFFG